MGHLAMVRPLPLHQTMLRITEVVESGTETTLHVEGRIVSEWVSVLQEECSRVLQESGARLRLDLGAVTFIDHRGVLALRRLSVGTVMVEPRWEAAKLGREALAYADILHNLARYLTRNATDAEDLVQETYTRALRAASQFTPGATSKRGSSGFSGTRSSASTVGSALARQGSPSRR